MDQSWSELSVGTTATYASQAAVTAVAFDASRELLWAGTDDGRLSSFYSLSLERRCSVTAHPSSILSLHPYTNGVLSLSPTSLRFHSRGGLLRSTLRLPSSLGSFRCSTVPDTSASLVLLSAAGADADAATTLPTPLPPSTNPPFHPRIPHSYTSPISTPRTHPSSTLPPTHPLPSTSTPTLSKPSLLLFDILTDLPLRQLQLPSPLTSLHSHPSSPYSLYVAGRADGSITLHDPRTLRVEYTLSAHTGPVLALSSTPTLLISTGLTSPSSPSNPPHSDPLLRLFDLRRPTPLSPLIHRTPHGTSFVRFLPPSYSPALTGAPLAVVSRDGRLAFGDAEMGLMGGRIEGVGGALGGEVTAFDLSSSGHCIVVGDAAGLIHQWGVHSMEGDELLPPLINPYSSPLDYVTPPQPPPLVMTFATPLAAYPFPYLCSTSYGPLASDLSPHTLLTSMRPIPPLDDRLFNHLRYLDHVGYAKASQQSIDTGTIPPPSTFSSSSPSPFTTAPNSLSTLRHFAGKGRTTSATHRRSHPPFSHPEYTRVPLPVPKYGSLSSLLLTQHNRTSFTALDSLLPNSYINSLLIALYFTPTLHSTFLSHLCQRENCLRCELGFLFHMMDGARAGGSGGGGEGKGGEGGAGGGGEGGGALAQPRNLLRALRLIPEAEGLGLLDEMDWREGAGAGGGLGDEGRWVLTVEWVKEEAKEGEGTGDGKLGIRIQDCYRFLLEQLRKEGAKEARGKDKEREQEERVKRELYHQQQLSKKQRAANWQLSQLHQTIARQGRATREQEDAARALTEELHQLAAQAAVHTQPASEGGGAAKEGSGDEGRNRVVEDVFGAAVAIERHCMQGQHSLQREATVLSSRLTYSQAVYTSSSPLPTTVQVGPGCDV